MRAGVEAEVMSPRARAETAAVVLEGISLQARPGRLEMPATQILEVEVVEAPEPQAQRQNQAEMVAPASSSSAILLARVHQRSLRSRLVMAQLMWRLLLLPIRVVLRLRIMSIRLMVQRGRVWGRRLLALRLFLT